MTTKSQVKQSIKEAWTGSPVEAICYVILDHLTSKRGKDICVINQSILNQWTSNKYSDDDLLKAVNFLSGRSPHLLDIQYVFQIDDAREQNVSRQEINKAKREGGMEHPETGEFLDDYEDYIYFYFRPSKEALQLSS